MTTEIKNVSTMGTLQGVSEVMNIRQCMELTGFSKAHIYNLTSRKEIPHYKRGKFVFFRRSEIETWLTAEKVFTTEEKQREADKILQQTKQKGGNNEL